MGLINNKNSRDGGDDGGSETSISISKIHGPSILNHIDDKVVYQYQVKHAKGDSR
jgi:hypothetical protein